MSFTLRVGCEIQEELKDKKIKYDDNLMCHLNLKTIF